MIFYDCEIINLVKFDPIYPDLKHCNGWDDFKGMGLSVIGYQIDDLDPDYLCPALDPAWRKKFKDLIGDHPVCGFNSISFDDQLLAANGFKLHTDFDLLKEVRISAYGSSSWKDQPRGYSYSLNMLAAKNLEFSKTGSGALAPILWQQGKHSQVIDYCKNDIRLLYQLYSKFIANELIDPNNYEPLFFNNTLV